MISIGKLINYVLTSTPDLVGEKVFPIIAPEQTQLPFIVYERDSIDALYTKDELTGNVTQVTIYILSDDYSHSIELAEKVREALEKKRFNYSGIIIKDCSIINTDEAYNDYAFIQKITFQFKTN